jgi:energy coupling factor transporter S component ThiW
MTWIILVKLKGVFFMFQTKKLTLSAMLIAIGTLTGHLLYIPVGVSKMFPVQHTINVLSGVLLGPGYAVLNAFSISLLRNLFGTGSLLAFPGSMIGAFLAGYLYHKTKKKFVAVCGEVIGTGILGALAAYPIVLFILQEEIAAFFYVIPFSISTIGGSIIAYVVLVLLARNNALSKTGLSGELNSK